MTENHPTSDSLYPDFPEVGPAIPRSGNATTRWIGRTVLSLMGWKLEGKFPNEPKLIILGAPHTSNWDLFLAMGSLMTYGVKASWMMKKEAFFWPLGGLWKAMGGIPIDRKAKNDVVGQITDWFNSNEKAWLGVTPEGTRSKVEGYRKGYLRMAYAANVPVFVIGVDATRKTLVLDRVMALTGDINADNKAIKAYVDSNYTGVRAKLS